MITKSTKDSFDARQIKKQFPIFAYKDAPFVYVDNAATTQKPQAVIDAIVDFYTRYNANIHRGVYAFGEQATQRYEDARAQVAQHIHADPDEIIFVKNATEGINLVADAWAIHQLKMGDEVLLTEYEHHANLLPWQRVAEKTGAHLRFIPVKDDGTLAYEQLNTTVTNKTKLVVCSASSNVTGAKTDISRIVDAAQKVGAKVLVDAAQIMAHENINVHTLDIDFLVFSGHKVFGPTGIGVLYVKKQLQKQMEPYQLGGGMVFEVDWHGATYASGPQKFEAGTPPIAQAIGLAAALQWLQQQDMQQVQRHEAALVAKLIDGLQQMPQVTLIGPVSELKQRGHLLSFVVNGIHAHDVAAFLSQHGIAVRAGHHCAQPLAKKWHTDATVRVSFACYTTDEDVDKILSVMQKVDQMASEM